MAGAWKKLQLKDGMNGGVISYSEISQIDFYDFLVGIVMEICLPRIDPRYSTDGKIDVVLLLFSLFRSLSSLFSLFFREGHLEIC